MGNPQVNRLGSHPVSPRNSHQASLLDSLLDSRQVSLQVPQVSLLVNRQDSLRRSPVVSHPANLLVGLLDSPLDSLPVSHPVNRLVSLPDSPVDSLRVSLLVSHRRNLLVSHLVNPPVSPVASPVVSPLVSPLASLAVSLLCSHPDNLRQRPRRTPPQAFLPLPLLLGQLRRSFLPWQELLTLLQKVLPVRPHTYCRIISSQPRIPLTKMRKMRIRALLQVFYPHL